jgi:WS/DGAT/MGAT family acyltransferase
MEAVDYLLFRGDSNPRTRSGFLGVEMLDRVPDWDRLWRSYDRWSRVIVRMRQKVVVPALPIAPARWVVDPDFDLGYHLRRVSLPAPGTLRQVLDLAEQILESPLDTSRPLWTTTLVEGVEGGRAALLSHSSHAISDGMGGIAMMSELFDPERDSPPRSLPPLPIPTDLSPIDLVREGVSALPGSTVSTARSLAGSLAGRLPTIVRHPVGSVTQGIGLTQSVGRVLSPSTGATPSPLLRGRSISRRVVVHEVPLDDLRRAAKAVGASVNDAYLSALCGALRRYHETLRVPIETLPMAVPVSLRTSDDPTGGNRFAGVTLAAPVGERDPAQRMRLVRDQIVNGKEEPAIDILSRIAPALSRLPSTLLEAATGGMVPPDVQASNVPSYQEDTYIGGARIERHYGLGPLPGVAMMVVMVSRGGVCTVTVRYDRAAVKDGELFDRCLREGFDEVLALGGEPRAHGGGAQPAGTGGRQ